MANLTDADKVIRNDVGKSIASKLDDIADAIVAQGGGAHSLGQLSDVDIDTTTLAEGQSIVYNPTTQKFENGEVSTVAALDDLTDVSITSAQKGDSLRNDGNGNWVNEPTKIVMTQAEWDAISDKQAWRNTHKNTDLILSDAPNLNATAQDISYDGGAETIHDVLTPTAYSTTGLSYTNCSYVAGGYSKIGSLVIVNMRITVTGAIANGDNFITGFPKPIDENTNMVQVANNANGGFTLKKDGSLSNGSTGLSSGNAVLFSVAYLTRDI